MLKGQDTFKKGRAASYISRREFRRDAADGDKKTRQAHLLGGVLGGGGERRPNGGKREPGTGVKRVSRTRHKKAWGTSCEEGKRAKKQKLLVR